MMRVTTSKRYIGFLLALSLLTGCAGLSPPAGFERTFLKTENFTLTAYYRFNGQGEPVTIYIEGDGNAWSSRTMLSDDPTPRKSLMLTLASADDSANVAYLARPGQYSEFGKPDCEPAYWSGRRFSKEVVDSMNEAIEELARRARSKKINLIGYSGGAAVAVLIAAQRKDVASLRTIAGNLDPDAVNKYHGVSLLSGSLNPMDSAETIKNIPQRHFVGSKDKIIPPFIAESFVKRMGDKDFKRITVVEGATHSKGWTTGVRTEPVIPRPDRGIQ